MKEQILKILMNETSLVSLYNGGGDESTVIAFEGSEDYDKKMFLSEIADKVLNEINKNHENL